MMVSADADDEATIAALHSIEPTKQLLISVRPREDSRGEKYDRALTEAPADVYLPAVDYAPIVTPGFDQIILDAATLFPDRIGCVYLPMVNASFPGLQAPTAKLIEMIGYIYNHDYPFWFNDHELDDICRMIGRYTFVDLDFHNWQYRPAKTLRLRDLEFWCSYFDAMAIERRAIARRIIASPDFKLAAGLKAALSSSYPAIEARSRNINAGVRASAARIEAQRGDEPDEGYLRAKARAEQKLAKLIDVLQAA